MSSLSAAPSPSWRTITLYCLPALLVGLLLRALLCWDMPLAFFSPDTNEFFNTRLIGGSRTFLPKLLYALPATLHLPLLPSIAVFQHILGLATVLAGGWLCVQWLDRWRWWIIPFTLLLAVQPTLLWYEHFALPDSTFILCLLLACLAGGRFYRQPSIANFAWLFTALFLTAGARQEGFLFLGFGVLLTLRVFWGKWRPFLLFGAVATLIALTGFVATRTNQGGYMLLTSLIQWAPDRLQAEPDLTPRIVQLRDRFAALWPAYPEDHNMSRKEILEEIETYVQDERGLTKNAARDARDSIAQKLAFEIARENYWRLPGLAFRKFRAMHLEAPAPDFGPGWAHEKQLIILFGKPGGPLPKENQRQTFYLGREFASREELAAELPNIYRIAPGDWISRFQQAFYQIEYGGALLPETQVGPQRLPALPIIYLFTALGFLAILVRDGRSLSERQLWILFLLGQAFVICLTGSLRSRYRLSFEPWFLLGVFCFLDAVAGSIKGKLLPPPHTSNHED